MPNPNNAGEDDACKLEVKRNNKFEEGACNIHKTLNAEKTTLGGKKKRNSINEQAFVSSNTNIMTSIASSSQKSPSTVDIPIIKESQGLNNHRPDVDDASKKATTALESFSPSKERSYQNDPHDKTAHTKDESFNVSVEKEITNAFYAETTFFRILTFL